MLHEPRNFATASRTLPRIVEYSLRRCGIHMRHS
jgi:hypothetical protein